jgi:FkbM family methyltransferase
MASFVSDVGQCILRMGSLVLRAREPALVWRDPISNGWLHRFPAGTLVSPAPRGPTWSMARDAALDTFQHAYTVKPGDVVMELGAGYGSETVFLARAVEPGGRVIAVEAHPTTFGYLRRTVELNALTNVELVQAAVLDRVGTANITSDDWKTNHVSPDATLEVPCTTLDELCALFGVSRIDLLKMNVEGAEREVVAAMPRSQLLVRNAVISCHDFKADAGDGEEFRTSSVVDEALASWGFTVERRLTHPHPWIRDYRYAKKTSHE